MGHPTIQGRGAALNPKNRFHELEVERDEWVEAEDPAPRTRFYRDPTRTIIATNDSPDVGFEASINPYRGCENGCSYCLWGATNVLMADGSMRFVTTNISLTAWRALGTMDGGETISE